MAYPIYNAPTPEEQEYARRLKMAEALRAGSPNMQGQMVSGHYIGPSWTQGLEKLFRGYSAGKTEREAEQGLKDWQTQGQQSMDTLAKLLQDPNATDDARNAALMAHTQRYGRAGIDTYLAAQNAATQAQNARTAAENARRKREAVADEAKQGEMFMRVMFPGAQFGIQAGDDDYQIIPANFDAQAMQVNEAAGREFGFDDDAMRRIMAVAAQDPKFASRIALEEYKRISKGNKEAKDFIAKERAMAEAMGMPVGEYLRQKMNKAGQQININNVMPGEAAEAAGRKEGMEIGEQAAMIENKYSAIDSVREAKDMLKQGIYSGYWGEMGKTIAKASLGAVGDRQKAARTEQFMSYVGNTVVPRLKEFGGNDSNEEMRYLQRIMGGDITMEPEAIAAILESAERKIARGIERLQRQRGALESGQMPDLGPGPARGQKAKTKVTPLPKTAPSVDDLLKKYGGK